MMNNWNEIFDYNPKSGDLRWRIKPCTKVRCGDVAGCDNGIGYLLVKYKGKQYYTHRIVYEMFHGKIPVGMEIDHKNRVKADNRIENLRIATRSENGMNCSMHSDNTSGTTGVFWRKDRNKWMAQLRLLGRTIHLGYYLHKPDAIAARLTGEKKHHGEFAQHTSGIMPVVTR